MASQLGAKLILIGLVGAAILLEMQRRRDSVQGLYLLAVEDGQMKRPWFWGHGTVWPNSPSLIRHLDSL